MKSFIKELDKNYKVRNDFRDMTEGEFLLNHPEYTLKEYLATKKVMDKRAYKEEREDLSRINTEKNQKPVSRIKMSIEWKRSRMWGSNPKLEAWVYFKDGTSDYFQTTCSGYGYDKESTVIANVFNKYLKYKLWKQHKNDAPYGIYLPINNRFCHYDGGIGTSCYYDISKFIGGELKSLASGKTYDAYEYTDITQGGK